MRIPCLLLLALLPVAFSLESFPQCKGRECFSYDDLWKALDRYQEREKSLAKMLSQTTNTPVKPSVQRSRFEELFVSTDPSDASSTENPILTCNICNSHPCQNGGICQVDLIDPWNQYICQCPGNYTGAQCQIPVRCEANTCGINAICSVSNHQTNCVCQQGFSGDPKVGCSLRRKSACCHGDPHYQTFDYLYFDYMGTCPAVFSQPCTTLSGGYDNYKVVQKSTSSNIVSQVTTTMYGQEIHFESGRMYFNRVQVSSPYYWPSATEQNITMTYSGSTYSVISNQQVQVTLTYNQLCIYVPDIPEFQGVNTLCGLAGNIDNNYANDVKYRNGTIYPVVSTNMPTTATSLSFNQAEDTWIEPAGSFWSVTPDSSCATGATYSNNTNCNSFAAVQSCYPILLASSGTGPFGLCQPMGNATIERMYDNCVYDVCHHNSQQQICNSFTDFVQQCMEEIPDTDLGPWRTTTNCQIKCGPHSHYSSCTSSCPATCSEHDAPASCNEGCVDSCECDYGYVVDNTVTSATNCIPIGECGCDGPDGNIHPADQPWINGNCSVWAECTNGTYTSHPVQCNQYAICGPDSHQEMACQCEQGFRGDGYNCTDINECIEDPHSCGEDDGWGTCTNTIGSYNCTCSVYRQGRDCQDFMPTRHCADYLRYWNATEDGVYTLHLPEINGSADYSNVAVYCDMSTDGGGWTLISHTDVTLMANKTYFDYEVGFGNAGSQNYWLGLEVQNYLTSETNSSLRLKIFRCGIRNRPNLTTECVYPRFLVNEAALNYSVYIPEDCDGSELDQLSYNGYDLWITWDQTKNGPGFQTFNGHDPAGCASWKQGTGWWYDDNSRTCGLADLNGARPDCSNPPSTTDAPTYLSWGGQMLLGDVWMYLRPAAYPNY